MAKKRDDVMEIINGISTVIAQYGYDGAMDGEEKVEIGLNREQGDYLLNSRIMDGFGVQFQNDMLKINYHTEILLKDVHRKGFEDEIRSKINGLAKFIKKQYKVVTGNVLTLTALKETFKAEVQSMSRIRSWVQASQFYKIGGASDAEYLRKDAEGDPMEASIRDWLQAASKKPPKPENVFIKPKDNEKNGTK